ncbi:carboxymuconolactone decarboxylase family protein [Streptomyces sp. NPDC005438]|uniref:carboxymuconolactone decarboxylase family protein n=1 Tax=Streptomyces sp. NPDC005438 TaxID=3156880 RepID=UPI0033BC5228
MSTDTTPAPRLDVYRHNPDIHRTMLAFSQAAGRGLDLTLAELVRIRASQINHCAFCLDMHLRTARENGETEERIHLLNAWEEAGVHTEREKAALALTEAVTLLTDGFVPDAVYARAAAHFDEAELAQLIALICAINSWNRLNVAARKPMDPTS